MAGASLVEGPLFLASVDVPGHLAEAIMAHLSARHGEAKQRRQELLQERSLSLALRTGYPVDHQKRSPSRQTSARPATHRLVEEYKDPTRYTAEELAEAYRRCQERVQSAREKDLQQQRQRWDQEQERLERSQQAGFDAPASAASRLRERKEHARQQQEHKINELIAQQSSSISAMNIARMLSPQFEEKVVFTPAVTKHSAEDERVKYLLTNSRVGSYYQ